MNLDWRESCGGVWAVHSSQSEPGYVMGCHMEMNFKYSLARWETIGGLDDGENKYLCIHLDSHNCEKNES